MIKSRTHRRSKKRFKTESAALTSAKKAQTADWRGLKTKHTATHWVFIFT